MQPDRRIRYSQNGTTAMHQDAVRESALATKS